MIDVSLYYNPSKLMSYNRILSFIIGARGLGKTYGFKKFAINRFLKHGEQFIYLRRYKSDITGVEQFFDTVANEFPDATFRIRGRELIINDELAGWIMPLSSWQSIKSREFPLVKTIIYDEFMLEKSSKQRYMDEEPKALMNFIDTVARNRSDVRCYCLSNAVSIINPYFVYFGILPDIKKRYNAYQSVVVEIPDSVDFSAMRAQTKFGQLIEGTDYGRFSLGNEFVNDTTVFIEKRSKQSKYKFSVIYKGMQMGVWVDVDAGIMFLSNDYDPSDKTIYALMSEDMKENTMLLTGWKQNFHLLKMVGAFKKGFLRFDNQVVRSTAYEMFKKMNVQ